ncbi:MAG: 23S rRNA (adenine(2503)-C(2))-methyltransferase RlmN [Syntrophorhabdaceae bacterium]|nr:23S rRNA (adenine(2503)-C(2))-methyltransferase RlmN [Syntrophorhabdaceae bacterium]MDD4196444.1 23S rRNA (adenine(2503)-C(2))-methyltransferase RlmN [Syntrophorhabdaceae bacterium]
MEDFFGFTLSNLEAKIGALGKEKYRARQLFRWIYNLGNLDFHEMTNIPKGLRTVFSEMLSLELMPISGEYPSTDGSVKLAFTAGDGEVIESVIMPEKNRATLCISTQIGCRMGCKFCVTGKIGFRRNLSTGEIVGQVMTVREYLKKKGQDPVTNIVFMGMGEPMDNSENVLAALDILKDQNGLDFSHRKITISSVGLIDGLKMLDAKSAVIAISLNAADDDTRSMLMPINRLYPIGEIMDFARNFKGTKRTRITFEYILIRGVNDSLEDARRLADLLKDIKCKINLIPYNVSEYTEFERPDRADIDRFHQYLLDRYYTVIIRDSRGQDVSAACGQLGMSYLDEATSSHAPFLRKKRPSAPEVLS